MAVRHRRHRITVTDGAETIKAPACAILSGLAARYPIAMSVVTRVVARVKAWTTHLVCYHRAVPVDHNDDCFVRGITRTCSP
jgi:hypothetical protein